MRNARLELNFDSALLGQTVMTRDLRRVSIKAAMSDHEIRSQDTMLNYGNLLHYLKAHLSQLFFLTCLFFSLFHWQYILKFYKYLSLPFETVSLLLCFH